MCPNIYIASLKINLYALCQLLGYVVISVYMVHEITKIQYIRRDHVLLVIFLGFFVQYFGGSILPYLYKWIYFHKVPDWRSFYRAGRYFHSVFLSYLAYLLLMCAWFRWPTKKVLDIFAIAVLIMSPIGRIGCFFQGCCVGKPALPPWGISFPVYQGAYLIPTQLYMLGIEMFLCFLLIQINKKKKYDGQTFWIAVFLYSFYRFLIEFLRSNPIFIFGLTHAQVFSIFTFCVAGGILNRYKSQKSIPVRD